MNTFIPEDLGAKFYSEFEADPRDFKVEDVLGEPKDISNLPDEVNLIDTSKLKYYFNQGKIPMCVAASGTNAFTISECIERQNNEIKPLACYSRLLLNHKCQSKEHGEYLENFWKVSRKKGIKVNIDGKDEILKIDGYAYGKSNKNTIKYYLAKGFPLHYATRGNRTMRKEMLKGEIKTIPTKTTGGHAIVIVGYDKEYLYFLNSWTPNDGNQYPADLSVFKVKWTLVDELIKKGIFNWRFFIFYNHKENTQLQEDIKLVEQAYKLGITKNPKEVELVKKGIYNVDIRCTIKIMREHNLKSNK